jgi:hypothetical protein
MSCGRVLALAAIVVAGCVDLTRPEVALERSPDGPGAGAGIDQRPGDGPGAQLDSGTGVEASPADAAEDAPAPEDAEAGADPDATPDVQPDAPLVLAGRPCAEDQQCASGHCSNGVCCDRACTDACFACNLTASPGTCAPVPAGEDPGNSCNQAEAATCGLDGTCDGAGACRRYQAGTACAPGRCESARELAASTCDGAGRCQPGTARDCAPGVCMGATCASTCSQQDQCQNGFFCDGNRCAARRGTGSACSEAFQCASGFCVDGVCCGSQCTGFCFACNVAGAEGTCTAVPAGRDPRSQCAAEPVAGCGRAGGCNGAGACLLHPPTSTCVPSSCSGATETVARTCDGLGVCRPGGATRDCAPYFCAGAACATSCASSADCQPGYSCSGQSCVRTPGLALYWRLEELIGALALDSSGNGFHGTYMGATGTPTPSALLPPLMYPNTQSRAFTLANRQAIRLAGTPPALRPTSDVSISVWFRTTATDAEGGTPTGAELVSVGNNYLVRLRGNPVGIEFSKRPAQGGSPVQCRVAQPNATDGNWHHLVGTSSAAEGVRLYFDGVLRCMSDRKDAISYTGAGSDVFVGRHANGEDQWDFGGNLDEIRIYTRALTLTEVMSLAQGRN